MEKNILLAVDGSQHSRNALRYVVQMAPVIRNLKYSLIHVRPSVAPFLKEEAQRNFQAEIALNKLMKKNMEQSRKMLDQCKALMMDLGVSEDCIEIHSRSRNIGLAKDIIEFAQEKQYDAIIVGRRGLSRLQEVLMGSLTAKLVDHSRVIPLWIVDGKVDSGKIMVAVDGSESALRAVDHVSFILGDNPDITVTLFHVAPTLSDYCEIDFDDSDKDIEDLIINGDKRCIDNFMAHAVNRFREAGLSEKQIEIKQIKQVRNVGRAIVEEAGQGSYSTVVVGRRGVDRAFFMGRVSGYVLEKISGRALWLVP